jgi:hypothetical protein
MGSRNKQQKAVIFMQLNELHDKWEATQIISDQRE